MSRSTNLAIAKLVRRAESSDPLILARTFVDDGTLLSSLSSPDHQILSGRRGTGKTHAFSCLESAMHGAGDIAIFIDMRTIGSSGGIYADSNVSLSERATRLLCDTLGYVHDALREYVQTAPLETDSGTSFALLERLGDAITDVVVLGNVEHELRHGLTASEKRALHAEASVGASAPKVSLKGGRDRSASLTTDNRLRLTGVATHRVHVGNVASTLKTLLDALPPRRMWILLDEWSEMPLDIQPLVADLLARAILPVRKITLKIAAIQHRSRFRARTEAGEWLGIEVGAAIADDVDLDEFMVFGNDPSKAREFFAELLYRHVRAANSPAGAPRFSAATEFVASAFVDQNAFDELVRAAEGVPRDAINVAIMAAGRAGEGAISVHNVRSAARDWYLRNKAKAISPNYDAQTLLYRIVDTVVGRRRSRAFLLEQGVADRNEALHILHDARVVHLLKQGVRSSDRPGARFDVYAVDYGCYAELMGGDDAPAGLFEAIDNDGIQRYFDVPTDDYRSIHAAVLDLEDLAAKTQSEKATVRRDRSESFERPTFDTIRTCPFHGGPIVLAECWVVATGHVDPKSSSLGFPQSLAAALGGQGPDDSGIEAKGRLPSRALASGESLDPAVGELLVSRVDGQGRVVMSLPPLRTSRHPRAGATNVLPSATALASEYGGVEARPTRACSTCRHPLPWTIDRRDPFVVAIVGNTFASKTSTALALMEEIRLHGARRLGVKSMVPSEHTARTMRPDLTSWMQGEVAARTHGQQRHPPLEFITSFTEDDPPATIFVYDVAGETVMDPISRLRWMPASLWADVVIFVYNPQEAPKLHLFGSSVDQDAVLSGLRDDLELRDPDAVTPERGKLPRLIVAVSKADLLTPSPWETNGGPVGEEGVKSAVRSLGDEAVLASAERWPEVHWRFISPRPPEGDRSFGVVEMFRLLLSTLPR